MNVRQLGQQCLQFVDEFMERELEHLLVLVEFQGCESVETYERLHEPLGLVGIGGEVKGAVPVGFKVVWDIAGHG